MPKYNAPLRKVKSRKLPSRALQLIREYSKPITRGDWRTFPRITKEKFVKYKDELDSINRRLYDLVHRHMYDYLYCMTEYKLYWLIRIQFDRMNCQTINPIDYMPKIELIYLAIQNEEIMKRPNCGQKKFFKDNQDIMNVYVKFNKINDVTFRKGGRKVYY